MCRSILLSFSWCIYIFRISWLKLSDWLKMTEARDGARSIKPFHYILLHLNWVKLLEFNQHFRKWWPNHAPTHLLRSFRNHYKKESFTCCGCLIKCWSVTDCLKPILGPIRAREPERVLLAVLRRFPQNLIDSKFNLIIAHPINTGTHQNFCIIKCKQ